MWYYRVKCTSGGLFGSNSYKDLGTYTCGNPSIVNWINQVTTSVVLGSSSSNENDYIWGIESRDMQGVNVSLVPTEINKLYLENGNHKLNFNIQSNIGSFLSLSVSVDYQPYISLYSGSPSTTYLWHNSSGYISGIGYHNLRVKYTAMSGQIYHREYDVYVVPKSDALYVDNNCNTMRVWKGNDPINGVPLILSEGFDAYNIKSEQYYREAGKDLINCLLKSGFNIYVINYNLNSQSIKNNAAIFQSAIRYISSINNNEKVIASGMSMGGLINRYACTQAESIGNPLPISKFLTIDAPHQGAYISNSLQEFVKNTNSTNNDSFSDVASNNEAAKELLTNHLFDPTSIIHSTFYNQLNSLNGDGYPHLVKKIGVAFSTVLPTSNNVGDDWLTIKIHTPISPDEHFNLENEEIIAGSFLPKLNKDPFIAGPNKYWWLNLVPILQPMLYPRVEFIQNKYPVFIPHNSALDITNGSSKFDVVITPNLTGFHDEIPSEIINPLIHELLKDEIYIQNKNYYNSKTIFANNKIFVGNNVTSLQNIGDVNIYSGGNIHLKSGNEIEIKQGVNVYQGANFSAVIEKYQCDGSIISQSEKNKNLNFLVEEDSLVFQTKKNSIDTIKISNDILFTVFPNPVEDYINVLTLSLDKLSYNIYNYSNQIIQYGVVENRKINVQNLTIGFYILEIEEDNTHLKHIFKIIKQ